ncbi:MAG TPA: hypothetical protein VFX45_02200 [Solirubrobacterales bacterium]|nr:hypothetical protein [Solirubrobacterales bacterium]
MSAPLAYLVGCRFMQPEREAEWNQWYNGPKLEKMLAKPGFLSCQRFHAVDPTRPAPYLAVWRVESPAVFETPEYTSDWGWADYAEEIGEWTRDLCELEGDDGPDSLACPADGALRFVRVQCDDAEEARAARDAVAAACPGMIWGSTIGLDRSVPFVGLEILQGPEHDLTDFDDPRISDALLRPLFEHTRSATQRRVP